MPLEGQQLSLGECTEAQDIKKRWQECTEELYKKELHNPDNHNGVITHLKSDILACEVCFRGGVHPPASPPGRSHVNVSAQQSAKCMRMVTSSSREKQSLCFLSAVSPGSNFAPGNTVTIQEIKKAHPRPGVPQDSSLPINQGHSHIYMEEPWGNLRADMCEFLLHCISSGQRRDGR